MGIADRFKIEIKNVDIFSPVGDKLSSKDIKFISVPTQKTEISKMPAPVPIKNILSNSTNIEDRENIIADNDLVLEIKEKIKNTPYWEEYSSERQTKMIGSYFEKRAGVCSVDKVSFINQVLESIKKEV